MPSLFTSLLFLSFALVVHAGIQQKDFTGIGHIFVLKSDDWRSATPKSTVGCLNDAGKLVLNKTAAECGVFERLEQYPYTLSSRKGNCTFDDPTQERNTESHYGGSDYAWSCTDHKTDIYDELYTIDGFPYVFLCFGDVACFYDAKKAPEDTEVLSLWQYHWGSQQMGITPGHVQMQLMWTKIGDLPKRESEAQIPGPRLHIEEGMQVPLQGARARS
ncbi:hypothetical protein CC86DRAFT_394442 [Ophiobolus disseminans]|uniref:Ecp2 effector protein domain-containing protein n=1 Tax=Ophiobolus disseminans TaxID=1469910 RepID=A0A6A6ZZK7_9PLEO|nr:hypothetical protein CC86DRAFT_394442 [Ophiobolus disseminans]